MKGNKRYPSVSISQVILPNISDATFSTSKNPRPETENLLRLNEISDFGSEYNVFVCYCLFPCVDGRFFSCVQCLAIFHPGHTQKKNLEFISTGQVNVAYLECDEPAKAKNSFLYRNLTGESRLMNLHESSSSFYFPNFLQIRLPIDSDGSSSFRIYHNQCEFCMGRVIPHQSHHRCERLHDFMRCTGRIDAQRNVITQLNETWEEESKCTWTGQHPLRHLAKGTCPIRLRIFCRDIVQITFLIG